MDIKNFFKKNKYIYNLNAWLKARRTKNALNKLSNDYALKAARNKLVYDPKIIPQIVKNRITQRGIVLKPKSTLNIFWVGASKEQDYSGFMQGLEKFGKVISFHNRNGSYGQEFSKIIYDKTVIQNNSAALLEQINNAIKNEGKIDLLIGQMWANYLSVETLKEVQKLGIVTMNIAMDDRLPEHWETYKRIPLGSIGLADGLDLVLTSCPDCCIRYSLKGCPSIFWPMASDPDLFKPAKEKNIDVCFVGNNYGARGNIIRKLMKNGIKVEAYGSGWPNGYIGHQQIADVFGRSKIILGIGTIAYNKDIYTLKLRDFDATMAGALYLTHRNPDLLKLFSEGKEIEYYSNEAEAIQKIIFYLQQDELRKKIALAAAEKARNYHTWEIRIAEALKICHLTS